MKRILLLSVLFLVFGVSYSQTKDSLSAEEKARREKNIQAGNPFKKFGYKPKIATLSKGKYLEWHDLDSIVQVGTFMYNTRSKSIVSIIERDTLPPSEATLKPEIVSRWMSPDPLSDEFPEWSPYNFVMNNPIRLVDPDGRAPQEYPIIRITKQKTGQTAEQSVLGYSGGATTQVDLYKVVVTDTEDKNFRMEFSITRDAWTVENIGSKTASNVAFEPKDGNINHFAGEIMKGGYPKNNGTEAIKLYQKGSEVMHAEANQTSVNMGYRNDADVAAGVMIHVGGNYNYKGNNKIAASEGCFGICNPGNSSSNQSNSYSNSILTTIQKQAAKSIDQPNHIRVIIEKREGNEYPTTKKIN